MIENALQLGADKTRTEGIISKVPEAKLEIELLAKKLDLNEEAIVYMIVNPLNEELANIKTIIAVNSL